MKKNNIIKEMAQIIGVTLILAVVMYSYIGLIILIN